jgi:hypothetical protein
MVAKSKGKKKLKEMGKAKDKQKVKEVAKEKANEKALGKKKMVGESCKGCPKKKQMNNRDVICPTCTHVFSYHAFCVEMNVHYVIIVITLLNG